MELYHKYNCNYTINMRLHTGGLNYRGGLMYRQHLMLVLRTHIVRGGSRIIFRTLVKNFVAEHRGVWSGGGGLPTSGAAGPMFLGGQRQYFSDKPKNFSDKPKIFPDDNILNLHQPPPPTRVDNFDNFRQPWQFSDNIGNFPTGLNNRGGHAPPWPPRPRRHCSQPN
jgi:hypothetical protein